MLLENDSQMSGKCPTCSKDFKRISMHKCKIIAIQETQIPSKEIANLQPLPIGLDSDLDQLGDVHKIDIIPTNISQKQADQPKIVYNLESIWNLALQQEVEKIIQDNPDMNKQQIFDQIRLLAIELFDTNSIKYGRLFCIQSSDSRYWKEIQNSFCRNESNFIISQNKIIGLNHAKRNNIRPDLWAILNHFQVQKSLQLYQLNFVHNNVSKQIDTVFPLKVQVTEEILKVNKDPSLVLFRLESLKEWYDKGGNYRQQHLRQVKALTPQNAYEYGKNKDYYVNEYITPYTRDIIRIYFDIDIKEHIKDFNQRELFLKTVIDQIEILIKMWSGYSNNKIDIYYTSNESLSSAHIFCNTAIKMQHIEKLSDHLQYLIANIFPDVPVNKIIDSQVYPNYKQITNNPTIYTHPKSLRFIGSDKIDNNKKRPIHNHFNRNNEDSQSDSDCDDFDDKKKEKTKYYQMWCGRPKELISSRFVTDYCINYVSPDMLVISPPFFFRDNWHFSLKITDEETEEDDEIDEDLEENSAVNLESACEDLFGYNNYEISKSGDWTNIQYNSGDCPICQKQHSSDGHKKLYQVKYKDGFSINCFRQSCHNAKGIKYKYDSNSQNTKPKRKEFNLTSEFPYTCHGSKESFKFDIRGVKMSYIISACGTGKTYQISENIKKLPKTARIIFISTRISFSNAITAQMKKDYGVKFDIYNEFTDDEALNKAQRLMIQVESLPRIGQFTQYDLVILDEAESGLVQMNSQIRDKTQITTTLNWLMNDAKYVIISDAFLTKSSFDLYQSTTFESASYQIVNNSFKPYYGNEIEVRKQKSTKVKELEVATAIYQRISKNKKCFSMITSRKQLKGIRDKLVEWGIPKNKLRIFHGKNMEKDNDNKGNEKSHIKVKKEIYDDISILDSYLWVGYTKTWTVGIDSQLEMFTHGFHIFNDRCASGMDFVQGISRFRKVQKHVIYLTSCATKFDEIIPHEMLPNKELRRLMFGSPINQLYKPTFCGSQSVQLQFQIAMSTQKKFLDNYKWALSEAMLRKMGYEIITIQEEDKECSDKIEIPKNLNIKDIALQVITEFDVNLAEQITKFGTNYFITNRCEAKYKDISDFDKKYYKIQLIKKALQKINIDNQQLNYEILRISANTDVKFYEEINSQNKITLQGQQHQTIKNMFPGKDGNFNTINDKYRQEWLKFHSLFPHIDAQLFTVYSNLISQPGDLIGHRQLGKTDKQNIIMAQAFLSICQSFESLNQVKDFINSDEKNDKKAYSLAILDKMPDSLKSKLQQHKCLYTHILDGFRFTAKDIISLRDQQIALYDDIVKFCGLGIQLDKNNNSNKTLFKLFNGCGFVQQTKNNQIQQNGERVRFILLSALDTSKMAIYMQLEY